MMNFKSEMVKLRKQILIVFLSISVCFCSYAQTKDIVSSSKKLNKQTLSAFNSSVRISNPDDLKLFNEIFKEWIKAFGAKDLNKTCSLFSENIVVEHTGYNPRYYNDICKEFKKIFDEKLYRYRYTFDIKSVYRENNLAVVRIHWFLVVSVTSIQIIQVTHDEEMDIFVKDPKGEWKIVRALAYSS